MWANSWPRFSSCFFMAWATCSLIIYVAINLCPIRQPYAEIDIVHLLAYHGAITLTLILSVLLKLRINPLTANFEALYCGEPNRSRYPARLDIRIRHLSRSTCSCCLLK